MTTHSPAGTYTEGTMSLNGKSLCGKSTTTLNLTTERPSCGQCARNLRTPSGMMRDARGALAALWEANYSARLADCIAETEGEAIADYFAGYPTTQEVK